MGVRYLCPVCERELKGLRTYCRHCHSRVKEPLIFKGLHLPNESDCYRNDVDYMDPRNMKKQQEHFYQHKIEMPDRPTISIGHEHSRHDSASTQSLRQTLEQGRAWLEEQSSASAGARNSTTRRRTVTYGTSKTTYNTTQMNKNSSGTILKIVILVLFLFLGNC